VKKGVIYERNKKWKKGYTQISSLENTTAHAHQYSLTDTDEHLGLEVDQSRLSILGFTFLKISSGTDKHIDETTAKANQTLGFLKGNLRVNSPALKEKAYKGLVRPQ